MVKPWMAIQDIPNIIVMTESAVWMWCLSKVEHAIAASAPDRSGGICQAVCGAWIYPLSVAKKNRRRCPICASALTPRGFTAGGEAAAPGDDPPLP